MVLKGIVLLGQGFVKLVDGIAGLVGGVMHGTGSTAHGTGTGVKRVGEGAEEGLEHIGKGGGEVAKGAGYAVEGLGHGAYAAGYTVERLGRWVKRKSKGYVALTEDEFDQLLKLEPEKQANQLEKFVISHKLEDDGEVRVPLRYITNALKHYEKMTQEEGKYKGRRSPLEDTLHKYAAVIAFGLAFIFLIPVTITGAAIIGQPGSSGIFSAFFIVLALLGIFALIRAKK
jgi:hypothetical protein